MDRYLSLKAVLGRLAKFGPPRLPCWCGMIRLWWGRVNSLQFEVVSKSSRKPVCAPTSLRGGFLTAGLLILFQSSLDWPRPYLLLPVSQSIINRWFFFYAPTPPLSPSHSSSVLSLLFFSLFFFLSLSLSLSSIYCVRGYNQGLICEETDLCLIFYPCIQKYNHYHHQQHHHHHHHSLFVLPFLSLISRRLI